MGGEKPSELPDQVSRQNDDYPYDNQCFMYSVRAKKDEDIDRKEYQADHGIKDADVKTEEGQLFIIVKKPL